MAMMVIFTCRSCNHQVNAWDEGKPYFLDREGDKVYAYHPDHEGLERCIGNDRPYICLSCAKEFDMDSRHQLTQCPECGDERILPSWKLKDEQCPRCKSGTFMSAIGAIS